MQDKRTKKQLLEELSALNRQIDDLKKSMTLFGPEEDAFEAIGNSMQVGIYIIQDHKTIFANAHMSSYSGYSQEELLTLSLIRDIVHQDDQVRVRECGIKMLKGEDLAPYEYRIRGKDGSTKWLMEKITSIKYRGQKAVLGNTMDVTNKKRTEDEHRNIKEKLEILIQERTSELSAMNEALKESEEYTKVLFHSSIIPKIVMDAKTGIYIDCNEAAVKIYGYASREEVIGKTPIDVSAPTQYDGEDSPTEAGKRIEACRRDGFHVFGWRHQRPNGQIWDADVHLMLFRHKGKPLMQFALQDISERKKAEEALRQTEAKYRNIIENATEGIFQTTHDGRYLSVNPALLRMFGFNSPDEMMKAVTDIGRQLYVNPEDRERFKYSMAEQGFVKEFEAQLYRKDKSIIWTSINAHIVYDSNGSILYYEGTFQDITERKRTEDALRESKERYKNFIEKSFAGVYVVQNGLFVFLNDNAASFAGYKPEELIGRQPGTVIHPDDRGKSREKAKKMLSGEDQSPYEFRIVTKDGQIRWIMEMITSIQFDGRKAILGNSMDITDRKLAEEALQASQEIERSILLSVPHGLFGVEQRRIFFANDAMEDVFGWKPEELIDKSTRVIFRNDEEWEEYGTILYSMVKTKPVVNFEWNIPFVRKDGREIFCRMSVSRIGKELGDSKRIVATFEDITNRKRAEDELRQSESTLRSVFLAAPVGICIMKNRQYQSANAFWQESFGYPEESIIGKNTRILYENDEEYDRVGWELYTHLRERGLASVETRLRRSDGVFREVILTAAPLRADDLTAGTVVIIHDVTERKQAEDELKESQRRLSDIIDFLPDATLVIDKDEKVIAWNRAIESMTGVKAEEMLGKSNYEYSLPFYGDRRPILIDLALHTDREKEKRYTAIQRVGDILFGESFTPKLPPGDIHLSATASVLRNSKGEIIAAIECIRDNTERKRLEERLNRAEKMEGLGRLAGGVAHDLNNVLGVLVGYSDLLQQKLPEDSSLRRYAENIQQSSIRAAAIIQDLLTLARRGVTISKVVDLNRIIFDYLKTPEFESLKSYHPNVKVWTELEEGLLNIKGSPIHLGKTIMNLISNASEAISDHGEVTIRTENLYLDQPIRRYDDMQEGDYVVLTVSDSGRGIPAKDLGKIFEPFFTKKVMGRSGTGLGLAVVWGTVKDHNGYIDVQSEEGKGTIFKLYFPVTREELPQTKETVSPSIYMGRGESILVVDDVNEQRELAVNMLGWLGYQVEALSSGEEAIIHLKNHKVDLVVLDMIMEPGIDGLETYGRIIEFRPKQKAIIVSGFSETDRVKKAMEIGAGAFVRKPYILEKIGIAVRKEIDRLG
ncbi:MAG: PAS domain S-box protein [Syntrophales bacterium]